MLLLRSKSGVAVIAIALGSVVGGAATFGPIYVLIGILSLAISYGFLTSTNVGLTTVFAIITLLPFGAMPFRAIITPNFLTLALAGLLGVWGLRMLAQNVHYALSLSPLGIPILTFLAFTFFALFLGAHGLPDMSTMHNYVKFILGVLFFFSIINCVRTRTQARFALRALIIAGSLSALVGLLLYALNDQTALSLLIRLGRIGYPTEGRILRFVEDDTSGLERAIGTSVDPNSFGGMLALVGALTSAQIFSSKPLLRQWILMCIVVIIGLTLLLTFSRAALFGLIIATIYLAAIRYHRLWWGLITAGILATVVLVGLGMGDAFLQRISEGVQFQDQAQQMRLAEYHNAINVIRRYPFFGIGFGQAPDIDLVAGVSSIYLAIAQRMGLLGLTTFLVIIVAWFIHTRQKLRKIDTERETWLLGTQAGLIAALAVGLADHYFFNIEFSHMVALFWGCAGLGVAIGNLQD